MNTLIIVLGIAAVFSSLLYLIDLLFPRQYLDIPQAYEAWIVFAIILILAEILIKNYKTKGLRGIEKWREEKKVDKLLEFLSIKIIFGIIFSLAAYQLLWKKFIV